MRLVLNQNFIMVSLYLRKSAQVFMSNIKHTTFYHDLVSVSKRMLFCPKGVISLGGFFLARLMVSCRLNIDFRNQDSKLHELY